MTGQVCRFFRPPYGVTNPNLAKAIRKSGLQSVGWNVRSLDTTAKNKEELLHRLTRLTRPGSIVLLHDRCSVTAEALTEYIDYCVAEGYTFVTL
ncbi:MAG: polysaccharide deacetylase family protein [Bacteroidota bacterium]|nr:MAG: polysaccharide deacetylase family protein [Bacteroidota bacterium]